MFYRDTDRVQLVHDVLEGRLQHPVDHVADQIFQPVQQLVKRDERTLALDVRVPDGGKRAD